MLLRSHLMGGASRIAMAPEDDQGFEFDDTPEGLDPDDAGDDLDPDLEPDDDDDLDPDANGGDPAGEPGSPSRGQTRAQRLANEKRQEKERADRLQAQLEAVLRDRSAPTAPPTPQESPQQRQARLAAMDAEDRVNYLRQEDTQRLEAQFQQQAFRTEDTLDSIRFDQMKASNPAFKAVAADVEKRLAEMRANGTTAPRETVAYYLIGQRAIERAGREGGKQRKAAAEGIDRNRARPGSSRSDVPAGSSRGGNEAAQRRKRLEGQMI